MSTQKTKLFFVNKLSKYSKRHFTYFQDVFLQGLDVFQSLWILVNNHHLLQWVLKYTQTLQLVNSTVHYLKVGCHNQHNNHAYTRLDLLQQYHQTKYT